MLALRHVAQALTGQATVGRHGDLAQRNLGTLFERWGCHHQQIAFLDHGVAIGQYRMRPVAQHQDHKHVRSAADIGKRAPGKRMSRTHLELNERHAVLVAVIVKGAAHVAFRIDHIELFRHCRQQRALHHNARHGNYKHQVKQVVATGNAGHHGKEAKDDRCRAAQTRPAYERHLAGVRPKGRQEYAYGDGAAHKEHERHECQARQQHLRQTDGRHEQAE